MKLHDDMKYDLIRMIEDLGITIKFLINGLIGGLVWSIYKKSKFWEAVRQIFIGGIISGYFTSIIALRGGLTDETVGFTSFVVGMMGMVVVDSFYKYVVSRFPKWKEAFMEFVKKLV